MRSVSYLTRWPQVVSVNVSAKSFQGSGRLTIEPGRMVLKSDLFVKRFTGVGAVTHTAQTVRVVHSRLLPPFMNVNIVVEDDDPIALISGGYTSIKEWRVVLEAAGFEIKYFRTWFSQGGWIVEKRRGYPT